MKFVAQFVQTVAQRACSVDPDDLVLIRAETNPQMALKLRNDVGREVDSPCLPLKDGFCFYHETALADSLLASDKRVSPPLQISDELIQLIVSAKEGRVVS